MKYEPLLQCGLLEFRYDTTQRIAKLYLPELECTDMRGAIKFVLARFPDALRIVTVSGNKPDVVYRRHGAEWETRLASNGGRK